MKIKGTSKKKKNQDTVGKHKQRRKERKKIKKGKRQQGI